MRVLTLVFLLSLGLLAQGPPPKPDPGLTWLGMGDIFTDDRGSKLVLMAFNTKYKDAVVGMYFTAPDGTEVRYYMNATAWDNMKQTLVKARDQWDTLTPASFKTWSAVPGYRIANRVAVIRFSLIGATAIGPQELLISCDGGASKANRVSIHLQQEGLKELVSEFDRVDTFFRTGK